MSVASLSTEGVTHDCTVEEDRVDRGTFALLGPSVRPREFAGTICSDCIVDDGHRNNRTVADSAGPRSLHNEGVDVQRGKTSTRSTVYEPDRVASERKATD